MDCRSLPSSPRDPRPVGREVHVPPAPPTIPAQLDYLGKLLCDLREETTGIENAVDRLVSSPSETVAATALTQPPSTTIEHRIGDLVREAETLGTRLRRVNHILLQAV